MPRRQSYSIWLEEKEREREEKEYETRQVVQQKKRFEESRKETAARKYSEWLKQKETYDRAIQLIDEINPERCRGDEDWFEAAVAFNAVDAMRGVYKLEEYQGFPIDRDPKHDAPAEELRKRKTLWQVFFKWSRDPQVGHEFPDITIPVEQAKAFTAAAQNMMAEYAEEVLRRKGEFVRASLKYTVPKVKQAAHDKRNLYNPDTAKYNAIYKRMCRQAYTKARHEMYERLDKGVEELYSRRNKHDEDNPRADLEKKVLYRLGLTTLARWAEQDAIDKAEQVEKEKEEKRREAEDRHRNYLKVKNRYKLRIPDKYVRNKSDGENDCSENTKSWSSGRMDFSLGRKGRMKRISKKSTANSFETIKHIGSNSKYIYCSKSKRDIENARKALEEEGHIFKENYLDEDGDFMPEEYERAKRELNRRKERENKQRERQKKATEQFELWAKRKEIIENCVSALSLVDKPSTMSASKAKERWELLGSRLKAVDVSLLGKFTEWSEGYKSSAQCKLMWDSWPPNVCDTCSASSMVQTTLLKILNRPGMNFNNIFELAVDRAVARAAYSDNRDPRDVGPEEREELAENLELNPKQFARMMEAGGVLLTGPEARVLMTLFDRDGNGMISRTEFLQFTGYEERPMARGEAQVVLRSGDLCIWEACDHVTGMTNAFEVVPDSGGLLKEILNRTKKAKKKKRREGDDGSVSGAGEAAESEYGESDFEHGEETEEENYSHESDFDVEEDYEYLVEKNSRPLYLKSGKISKGWVRVPLKDFIKRKKFLLNNGTLQAGQFVEPPPETCQLAKWKNTDRESALREIQALGQDNKAMIKSIEVITNGNPPLAPVVSLHQDVDKMPDEERQSCLKFSWQVPTESPKASFYVLETSGKEGSKSHRNHEYHEVLRDPPNATMNDAHPALCHTSRDLLPNTKYFFRIRAFNGYGASPFTYVTFCTAPSPPPRPLVVASTSTSVTICWDQSKHQLKFLGLLRDIFDSLNPGKDEGCLSEVDSGAVVEAIGRDRDLQGYLAQLGFATCNATGRDLNLYEYLDSASHEGGTVQWVDLYQLLGSTVNTVQKELSLEDPQEQTRQLRTTQYRVLKCVSDEEVNPDAEGCLVPRGSGAPRSAASLVHDILKSSDWMRERTSALSASRTNRGASTDASRFEVPPVALVEAPASLDIATEKPAMLVVFAGAKEAMGSSQSDLNQFRTIGRFKEPVSHVEVLQPVYLGTESECTITGLEPGQSYQFRVQAATSTAAGKGSANQVVSRLSRPVVFHCPLPRPPAPAVLPVSAEFPASIPRITADSVVLSWSCGYSGSSSAGGKEKVRSRSRTSRREWTKEVEDWVREPNSEQTGGVSSSTVRKTFMKYDLNGDGHMDAREIKLMFNDLGLKTSGVVFEDALQDLDRDGNGTVEFVEFERWWRASQVKFKVLRDAGQQPAKRPLPQSDRSEARGTKVTVYHGPASRVSVGNLCPNTEYRFFLQHLSHKAASMLSRPLVVTTVPEVPRQPVVAEACRDRLTVKWYPGIGGADTFHLEMMRVGAPEEVVARTRSRRPSSARFLAQSTPGRKRAIPVQEWTVVYSGRAAMATIGGLSPGAVYRLRAVAVNASGGCSDPSLPAQCATRDSGQPSATALASKENAGRFFTVECTGDVVAGDTLLFTERVFEKSGGSDAARGWSSAHSQVSGYSDWESRSTMSGSSRQRRFITERTIAARVVNTKPSSRGTQGRRAEDVTLVMQVIWCTVSNEYATEQVLKQGMKIMRDTTDVFKFETFRARWVQEEHRWSAKEEQEINSSLQ